MIHSDLRWLFPPASAGDPLQQVLATVDQPGDLISGSRLTMSTALQLLLTEIGSSVCDPLEGCTFLRDAKLRVWRTPADVSLTFYAAVGTILRYMEETADINTPDSERLTGLDLLSVEITNDRLLLYIQGSFRDGTQALESLPVAQATLWSGAAA